MSLDVTIGVKNAAFRAGLEQMRGQAKKFSGDLKGMLVGAFSIAAITGFAEKMREVQKEALRFGTSAESIQRVGKVAKMSGLDFELLAKSINKVTMEAGKAARGGAEQARMFELLGIDAKKFVGMSLDEKVIALSTAFKESQSSGMKTSAMLDLIGQRGSEIIPLLSRGPDALSKGMKEATVQTNSTVAAMANLDRSIQKIKAGAGGLLAKVMAGFTKGVAYASALMNDDMYQKLAEKDMVAENAERKKGGRQELTGIKKANWISDRENDLMKKDVEGGLADAEKPFDDAQKPADDFAADQGKNSAESKAAMEKQIAEEEAKARADALSGQAKINELNAQRAALAKQVGQDEAANLEIKKQDLALEREINDLKKSQAEKLQAAKERQADVKEKQALAKMTPDQQRAYLEKKQADLFAQANEMEEAPNRIKSERAVAAQARIDEKDYDGAEKTFKSQGNTDQYESMRGMKLSSRKLAIDMGDDADRLERNSDPAKAVELRTKALEMQDQIDALKKGDGKSANTNKSQVASKKSSSSLTTGHLSTGHLETGSLNDPAVKVGAKKKDDDNKPPPKFTVAASNLQRVGGGGRAYGTTVDDARRAREKTNQLLQKIADAVSKKDGAQSGQSSEPY